jgi:hypothetical protein
LTIPEMINEVLEVVPGCSEVQAGTKCRICGYPTGYSEFGETYCYEPCAWALRVLRLIEFSSEIPVQDLSTSPVGVEQEKQ